MNPYDPTLEISADQLTVIETKLREDIEWTIFHGPGFDASRAANMNSQGIWDTPKCPSRTGTCGVCAIGSYVIHRQPRRDVQDYAAFALTEGVSVAWAYALYRWVERVAAQWILTKELDRPKQIVDLAVRLVDWAGECQQRKSLADSRSAVTEIV